MSELETIDNKVEKNEFIKFLQPVIELVVIPGKLYKFTLQQAKEEGLGFCEKAMVYPGMILFEGFRIYVCGLAIYEIGKKLI